MKRKADTCETGKCANFTWHDGAQISQYILRWSCMRRDVLRNNKRMLELSEKRPANLAKMGNYEDCSDWFLARQFLSNEKASTYRSISRRQRLVSDHLQAWGAGSTA
jgi:hypothetical protein